MDCKSLIPLSFFLLIITTIGFFIKNLNIYKGYKDFDDNFIKNEIDSLKCDLEEHKFHVVNIDGKEDKGDNK